MSYYTIVVPLRFQDNLLSITDPLSLKVWICFLICIPTYIAATIVINYLYSGSTQWEAAASSIIRGALSERKNRLPPKHLYQKLLVLVWSWMMVILISSYKGNLLAMITKPTMKIPFINAEGFINQTQIVLVNMDGGLLTEYARSMPPGTTMRKLYDQGIKIPLPLCAERLNKFGNNAATCDISQATSVLASEFSRSGTCKYYMTDDKILPSDSVLAFPVSELPVVSK